MLKSCLSCNQEFNAHEIKVKYCSKDCSNKGQSNKIEIICPICHKQFSLRQSHALTRTTCSRKCSAILIVQTGSAKKASAKVDRTGDKNPNYKNGAKISREKNPNWKGGITYTYRKFRKSAGYQKWRTQILERDSYKCIKCGSTDKLHVDHIIALSADMGKALDIDNGRTLCFQCHIKTDTYGAKSRSVVWYNTRKGDKNEWQGSFGSNK